MAKTFKAFMDECMYYPHSQESLELMKECAELSLTEKYIEDQQFLLENTHLLDEATGITSGYFSEAVNDASLEVMMEKATTKALSIKSRIWKGLQKIVGVFQKFFQKIGNNFDEVTSGAQKCVDKLAKLQLDEASYKKLQTVVKNARAKAQNFAPVANQPYGKKIKINYQATDAGLADLKAWLAAGLSNTTVVADVTWSESTSGGTNIGALSAEQIKDAIVGFALDGKGNLKGCLTNLASTFADAKQNGITIRVNTKAINKNAEDLGKIKSKLDEAVQGMVAEGQGAVNAGVAAANMVNAVAGGGNSEDIEKMAGYAQAGVAEAANAAYGAINVTIGASMKIYTGLNAYRAALVTGLTSFLKDTSAEVKDDAGAKKQEAPRVKAEKVDPKDVPGAKDKKPPKHDPNAPKGSPQNPQTVSFKEVN